VLVETVARPWKASLLEILAQLLQPEQKYFSRYAQLHLAALIVSEALARRERDSAPEFIAIARRTLPLESKALENFISTLSPSTVALLRSRKVTSVSGVSASIFEASGRTSVSASTIALPPPRKRTGASIVPASSVPEADERGALPTCDGPKAKPHPPITPESAGDFALMVAHAGLILLHPFLPRFLESTGVKHKAQESLSSFVLPRAAALLHFLATGQEEIFEYDLAFIKILLGLRPDAPLCVSEGLFVGGDKTEAETLLQSVIDHWTVLKKTSVAGLRTSFLQRQGLLYETETGWKLQVERQPFDVLLEHLPWSISVIKLPWMTRIIHTEW
jgi:hypothetical protein